MLITAKVDVGADVGAFHVDDIHHQEYAVNLGKEKAPGLTGAQGWYGDW
jgi:hypothetical protein